jgi:hypothetical protein
MTPRKILAKVLASPANVRFADAQRLVEAFGSSARAITFTADPAGTNNSTFKN